MPFMNDPDYKDEMRKRGVEMINRDGKVPESMAWYGDHQDMYDGVPLKRATDGSLENGYANVGDMTEQRTCNDIVQTNDWR